MFQIRTTKPGASNKCYIRRQNGGWSWCVQGSPTDKDCNVLANCVGYACGRFNEVYNEIKRTTGMKYYALNCNAENFIERAKSIGLEVVDYPVLGGIMVWQKGNTLSGNDGAGHVAFVEKIYDKNHIYTSESGYGSSAFWNSHRYNTNGRWGLGSGYKFRGCIVNPAIGKIGPEEPKPEPEPVKPVEVDINPGDTVIVNGVGTANSYGGGARTRRYTNHKMKVIAEVKNDRKHPFALNQYNTGKVGDFSQVTGWFAKSDIKKV